MLKGLGLNPYINEKSSLEEIETELASCIERAEQLDWDITDEEERAMTMLTRLARAKGSKKQW